MVRRRFLVPIIGGSNPPTSSKLKEVIMSYAGGQVFCGFELTEKYIARLMSDIPLNKWGHKGYSESQDVHPRLEKLLGSLRIKTGAHGTQDGLTFYVYTDSYHVHAGESQKLDLKDPSTEELELLREAGVLLNFILDEAKIGWHLAAFWD